MNELRNKLLICDSYKQRAMKRLFGDANAKFEVERRKYLGLGNDLWNRLLKKLSSITKRPVSELRTMNSNQLDDVLDELYDKNQTARLKQAEAIFDAIKEVSRLVYDLKSSNVGIDVIPKLDFAIKSYRKLV